MPAWQLFPNLWVDKRVEVSCPDGQVTIAKRFEEGIQLYIPPGDTWHVWCSPRACLPLQLHAWQVKPEPDKQAFIPHATLMHGF